MSAFTQFELPTSPVNKMNKGLLLFALILAFSFFLFNPLLAHAKQSHQHHLNGSHGMVLVYDKAHGLFASHLPLYFSPHHYQIIYKISLKNDEQAGQLTELFERGMVTMLPARFDLNQLVRGEQFTIEADFFTGHFERGGEQVFKGEIKFDTPVLIKPVERKFKAEQASFYQVALDNNSALVVHKIQAAPSFDAIGFIENSSKNISELSCQRPDKSALTNIEAHLTKCSTDKNISVSWHYLETQDFQQ